MIDILRTKVLEKFDKPVGSPRDCEFLSKEVFCKTGRSISQTTLRRFFGMLKTKSAISAYNLDTLSIYCGSNDYTNFCKDFGLFRKQAKYEFQEIDREISHVTRYTLNSISRKSLMKFSKTIPREQVNKNLNEFLSSDYTVISLVAPGGYGKSLALAHWIKSLMSSEDHRPLCFFCTAPVFYQLLSGSKRTSTVLNFNLSDSRNLLRVVAETIGETDTWLVLVIDGLDELEGSPEKMNYLLEFVNDAANQYFRAGFLKIILSSREVTWNKYFRPEFEDKKPGWKVPEKTDSVDTVTSNLPLLSHSEVKEIIARYNSAQTNSIVYESIVWGMKEMIRVPLHLHFLTLLISNAVPVESISVDRLMFEYMENLIFSARYSEEKLDIVKKIIELSPQTKEDISISKAQLKAVFPIHLKTESFYFAAYNDLLSYGILVEEKIRNKFGVGVTTIHFRHSNFYYYLVALFLLDGSEEVSFDMFRQIADSKESLEWRSNVIANLFRLAYQYGFYNALEKFCMLPEEIISAITVRHAVGSCFRQENRIRMDLIREFAKSPAGQEKFFEWYVDTNHLFNNYVLRIREYLEHKKTREARLFGHGILFLAGFYGMDAGECMEQIGYLNGIEPNSSIHPWPIGRKVSSIILHRYIVKDDPFNDLEGFISSYTSIAYEYQMYLEKGVIEYEMMIMVALVLLGEYKLLIGLVLNAYKYYKLDDPKHAGFSWMDMHQNRFAELFLDYARFKIDGKCNRKVPEQWESILDKYATIFDDFYFLILIHYFLFDFYMDAGDFEKALLHHNEGMKLSKFAKYQFYEAFLLKKGSVLNEDFGIRADSMIISSGFNQSARCFQTENYPQKIENESLQESQ
jgi:hypothetical protein